LVGETQSLCPECLALTPARRIAEEGNVYLEKDCPDHGKYKTLIWRGDANHYLNWSRDSQKAVGPLKSSTTNMDRGCPYDCGLCPGHNANACSMLMEVTQRCNLRCPICFDSCGNIANDEPDLETIREMYQTVLDITGTPTIQLSGGEPTIRDDLPEIVSLARQMGFIHIMINTNGVRLAKDKEYVQRLVDNGASTAFLQFDGVTDDVYQYTRGADLAKLKTDAISNCAEAKLGVVLVPTVIPGVNDHQLGDIVQFAKQWIPTVKGIHFQPVSYFGRYPQAPSDEDRTTMPDVIAGLVEQTGGELQSENFLPRRSEDSHCQFSSLFVLSEGRLQAMRKRLTEELVGECGHYEKIPSGSALSFRKAPWESARSFMNLHLRFTEEEPLPVIKKCSCGGGVYQELATHGLTITCMPFQDVWTLDLERLKRCCTHVVTPSRQIIPFCAYYLTSAGGQRLYSGSNMGNQVFCPSPE